MNNPSVRALAVSLCLAFSSLGSELPEQFRVWGSVGPVARAIPAGWTEKAEKPEVQRHFVPSDAELPRGFVLFARDPFLIPPVRYVPGPEERASELITFAAPGEYEPLALGLHALEDLSALECRISDLRGPSGAVIPSSELDLRVSRDIPVVATTAAKTFYRQPFLLERRSSFSVQRGQSVLVWVTLHIPLSAKPGQYAGSLSVRRGSLEPAGVKLSVEVMPFKLPPPPVEMAMCYPRPAETHQMLVKELTDLREHGADLPVPAMEVRVKTREGKFSSDGAAETIAHNGRLLAAYRKVYSGWRFPATFEVGHQIAYAWDQQRSWFEYWKHSAEIEGQLVSAIELIQSLGQTNRIPSLRAQIIDEGGAHNLLDEAIYYNSWIHEHFPKIQTTTTIGGGIALGHDEIGQLSGSVDFLSINRFTPEIARALLASGKPYGVYNGGGANPASARFFFGFYGHKTAAQQILQWAYSFGESVFAGNGLRLEDEGFVYHAVDGPLPSIIWEATREGIDDSRYIELLRQYVSTLHNSSNSAARAAAGKSQNVLDGLLNQIGWGFQAMQSGDRTEAPHPSTLRKWRRAIADEIVRLQQFLPDQGPGPAAPVRSPLELSWPPPAGPELTRGPELFPSADFESILKPWRVEAWIGHGRGEMDTTEHHGGNQSLRINCPNTDGNGAVTVLVWPRYGENQCNLSLPGDRSYELSAWAKMSNRATLPEPRINVPDELVATARTGADAPNPEGWRRVWRCITLKSAAQPSYLAFWIQGPGTVWLDDLSLREVLSPALHLTLDQEVYDSADKLGVVSVWIGKGAEAVSLRCALSNVDGAPMETQTVPLQHIGEQPVEKAILACLPACGSETCRFTFSPAGLKPGTYSISLQLLGAQEAVLAARDLGFKRL